MFQRLVGAVDFRLQGEELRVAGSGEAGHAIRGRIYRGLKAPAFTPSASARASVGNTPAPDEHRSFRAPCLDPGRRSVSQRER
jgi:hypothetical protein